MPGTTLVSMLAPVRALSRHVGLRQPMRWSSRVLVIRGSSVGHALSEFISDHPCFYTRQKRLAHTASEAIERVNVEPVPQSDEVASQARRTIQLRPYQQECLAAIRAALDRGITRMGVSSPTGSGKTTIFAELIEQIPAPTEARRRVLVLVSSIQLAQQTADHIARRFPDLWIEIEQGQKHRASGYADVTVATWQTLISTEKAGPNNHVQQLRLEKFDPQTFKAVIVDEAHHAASRSWRVVLNYFHPDVVVDSPEADEQEAADDEAANAATERSDDKVAAALLKRTPIIGFSATFVRHDGISLGAVFEEIVFHRDVLDLISEKWLSPLRFTSVQAQIPLDKVAIAGGEGGRDFATTSLASVINVPVVNKLIVRSWLSRTQKKSPTGNGEALSESSTPSHTSFRSRTLVFAVNVKHVYDLTDEFRAVGIDARALTGSTGIRERRELLTEFAQGNFPVLVNCAILTEGADIPSIDCVVLARPTLSRNLFSQMIGRGMRLSPSTGKQDCLILDLVGSSSKGVVCAPTLFGLDPNEKVDDLSSDELMARREDKEDQDLPENAAEAKAWSNPHLDPMNVKFIDWESAQSLHQAMSAKALFSAAVERYSSNAWIDCGDDNYIIDVPPQRGYAKVERVYPGHHSYAMDVAIENGGQCWLAQFTAKKTDGDDTASPYRGSPWKRAGVPVFLRPRKITVSATLEQAIHAADTYIATRVLRNSGLMRSLMSRFARWRAAPASTKQVAFVEKRLGLTGSSPAQSGTLPPTRLDGMTKGEASIILTRLMHGAKRRWQRDVKEQNRLVSHEQRIAQRQEREKVKVGKL